MKPESRPVSALIIEDSEEDALLLVEALRRGGYKPDWKRVETESALRAALAEREWDVVFCDYAMPLFDAPSALRVIRETGDTLTAIVVSGQVGEEVAVEAMRLGANDFVLKHNLGRVVPAMERELRSASLRKERWAAAVALRQSEERYRVLFDKSPWPMWVYDPETLDYLAVNDTAIKIYGYTREEYLAMTVKDLRPTEDVPVLLDYFQRMESGEEVAPERIWRHRKKDGSVIVVEIAHQPITFNGKLASVVQAVDITARKETELALRSSETSLQQAYEVQRSLFDALPAHIALVDAHGVILAVNTSWKRFGAANKLCHPNFCIGENYLGVCRQAGNPGSEEAKKVAAGLTEVLKRDRADFACEYPCHSPEEKRWFRLCITPLEGGPDTGAVVMHIDISERIKAELALRDSEDDLRLVLEAANDGVWKSDFETGKLIWSDRMYEMLGLLRTTFSPTIENFTALIHSEDLAGFKRARQEYLHNGGRYFTQMRIRRSDGTYGYFLGRGRLVNDAAGQPVRMIGSTTDVTKIFKAEEQIREQAALLDHARDAILVQNLEGRIEYWNKSAERVFGWTAEEVAGNKVQDLLYESSEPYRASLRSTLSCGGWIGELTILTKAGGEVLIEGRWTLVRDSAGNPKAILSINTDITEKKKIEAQFFRAQRMESIGTLAGGIAHDLNNVLSPIIMAVELLKARITNPRDYDLLEMIETSGQRGADMVKQVLFFARGIEGQRVLISPKHLISELERIIRDTFPKSLAVETRTAEETWNVFADRTQLHQVLLNLCVNARDAMPGGGRLRITTQNRLIDEHFAAMHAEASPGPYVCFEVADTGEGMSKEVVERIFEPFFTTKAFGQGTGLGLSTTHAIVKSHGGFINVESEPGTGTTFYVNLPAESGPGEVQSESVPGELPRGSGELILIIDDEAAIRSISGQTLEAFGYQVMTASDGAEGVAAYAQHAGKIAAVLTDMMMPIMDGAATIRVLRRLDPNVKIIAVSGLNSKAAESEAAGIELKYFLPKPYTAETLLQTLGELLHPK
ncbi:MAG: sensor hybrid histidine kinase [Chthoniobacteraceae bacterium]|nr:sensor hybrid histidine kinase [Chthoniobacteraceae bacterium]